ncbi:MAG: Ig-like domain repeat protein [Akkermansiaceae bacterium]|nr:Ig-like domain repeat protein [Akkermansiaceae bacterium]
MKTSGHPGMHARNHSLAPAGLFAALLVLALVTGSPAAPITKAATGTDLTAGASWGGTAPASGDVATWTSTSLGAGLTLGSSRSWSGISVAGAASAIDVTGAGTLTLGSDGIEMSAATVNLTWGTPVALGSSQTWNVNSGRTLTASGIISGPSMVLTKAGAGTLTIKNAANTYSGGTIINAGQLTVDLQADAALGTGPVTLNGGRLYLQRITAANALTVNGGDLYPENGFGDSWNGPVTLNSNLIIQGPNYAAMTFNGSISGTGGLTLNGQGPVVLQVANSYSGPTSVTACELKCNNKDALGSGALSISSTANSKVNLTYTGTKNIASLTLGGIPQIGGSHGSTASTATTKNDTYFSGTGTVTVPLSTAKDILTFSFGALGAAAVGASTVNLDVPIGTNRTALAPTFTLSPGATCSPASGISQNFNSAQTYTVTAQDGSTKAYTVTVTEAVLPDIFTWATAASGNWSDASKWTNEAVPTIIVAPQAGGRATYTLNFNVAGTYTATHNLNAGFLLNRLNFGGATTIAGTNSLVLTNNGATLPQLNQNSTSGVTVSVPLSLAANLTLGGTGSGSVSISGGISSAGSLTKNNSGTLTLSGAGTYSGGTTINSGSVSLGSTSNTLLGTGTVTVNSPATLNLNGNNNLTNTFILNGATLINGNSFSANLNGPVTMAATSTFDLGTTGNMSIGGIVSGTGGLTKKGTGAGPLILSGNNSFTGPVTVQAGTLSVAALNRVGGGTATSNLGAPTDATNGMISLGSTTTTGTLLYTGAGETTDRVIKLAGTTGGATLAQGGTASGITTTRGDSGLLKFTSDVSIPGTAGADNRKTLTLTHVESSATGTNPGRGEISGSIGNSLTGTAGQLATSITKTGSGTWTLSGPNTYSGATKVQAGTLAITRSDALGSGALDISTGARVQLDYIGTRQLSALTFNAGAAQPNGTFGSSSSPATNKDDTRFAGAGTVTVGAINSPTTTTLARTAGSESSNGGVAVTFTATVAGTAPAGSVRFYDGLTLIGTGTLNGSYQASLTTSTLGGGVHAIIAQYVGDAGNAPSTSTALTQTVVETRAATTTTLASGGNPSTYGAAVTFTATVTGGGSTGSVTFWNGTSPLGTATVNGSAQASLTTTGLAVGWNAITARYSGNATHAPSATAAALFQSVNPPTGNGKLKVYILAGQSNMQGKGRVETGRDPGNPANTNLSGGLGSLRNMLNRNPSRYGYLADPAHPIAGGNPGWITRSDVGVTYWSDPGTGENRRGILDANFGDTGGQGRIGPEYAFGLQVGSQLGDQVLLIKYAFGGKSLIADFRPPSSGGTVGPYYTGMISRVNQVLADLATYSPGYTGGGYEIAGFAWHQGWNDLGEATAVYEANLVNLIKDLRTEFGVPNLPVVIANTGMANGSGGNVLVAQMNVGNPALHPEFAGTVITVDTRPFDFGVLLGGSDEGYHWNWNAGSYFNIGEGMGKAMMAMRPAAPSPARDILTFDFPGLPATTIAGTTISVTVPYGTDVSALAPTYTLSPLATCAPASGTVRNFTAAQSYTVTAQDLSTQAYTVTVSAGPSPYQSWSLDPAQGLTAGLNDGPNDDPDHDGVVNLLEFALGGDPMAAASSILPLLADSAGTWVFEYDRSIASRGPATTQIVEYGDDLSDWTELAIPATTAGAVTITPGPNSSEHVAVALPALGVRGFARLKVSQ